MKRLVFLLSSALLAAALVPQSSSAAPTAPYIVNSTADTDDGTCNTANCTLREAINAANTNAGPDAITFNIHGGGVKTIRPHTALPVITQSVTIDGYSQPGATPNSLPVGNDAVLKIQISGQQCPGFCDGLNLTTDNSTIQGLVINRFFSSGIRIYGSLNVVQGNFIGTNANGTAAQGNGDGVLVSGSASIKNLIGGTTPAARNLLSGNSGSGAFITDGAAGGGHTVQGNYIGTNAAGTGAVGNGYGVTLISRSSVIGGNNRNARNLISGNSLTGITLGNSGLLGGASDNVISANFIGTTANGRGNLGNGAYGIYLGEVSATTIGGDRNAKANRIAYNGGPGIYLSEFAGLKNAIHRNRIFSNTALGIDLVPTGGTPGVTPNDAGDADTGPNNLQNFPVVKLATSASRKIKVKLNSAPNSSFTFEFFTAAACDPSNYGEGNKFIGTATGTTNGLGNVTVFFTSPRAFPVGARITATATDSSGNTSEFSNCKTAN